MIDLKRILNGMKAGYKEDLAEQRREWEKWEKEEAELEKQEWFKSLTEKYKAQGLMTEYSQNPTLRRLIKGSFDETPLEGAKMAKIVPYIAISTNIISDT